MKQISKFRIETYGMFIDLDEQGGRIAIDLETGHIFFDEVRGLSGAVLHSEDFKGFKVTEQDHYFILSVVFSESREYVLGASRDCPAMTKWLEKAESTIRQGHRGCSSNGKAGPTQLSSRSGVTHLVNLLGTRHVFRRRSPSLPALLLLINRATCYNQGAFLDYSFLASERHKELKQVLNAEEANYTRLSELAASLINFLNQRLHESVVVNFKFLETYFQGRHPGPPRFCVKGNFRTADSDLIVSVFRDRAVNYVSDSECQENTGFQKVVASGKYYLQNDIPSAASRGEYINPRLKTLPVRNYEEKQHRKFLRHLFKFSDTDYEWAECWEGGGDLSSAYKSTLIIPMTLVNSHMSSEFIQSLKVKNVDRTIFGFLCIDHTKENYFREELDVHVGYIFADMISLYLFARLQYTEISETFHKVEQSLKNHDIEFGMEKLRQKFAKLDEIGKLLKQTSTIPETTGNQLVEIDSNLVTYAKS